MRPLVASIIAVGIVAVTAAVFAIWPVIADAPWEETLKNPPQRPVNEVRCEAALDLRQAVGTDVGIDRQGRAATEMLERAEREISRFC